MTNCKFWEFSVTELVSTIAGILGVIISAITLFIAYKIFRNFDAKKTHINKQLETVLNLIEEINKKSISVEFKHKIPQHILEKMKNMPEHLERGKSTFISYEMTLFSISRLKNPKVEYGNVLLNTNTEVLDLLTFIKYIYNPLLPTSISDRLKAFYSPVRNFKQFDNLSENFVVLSPNNHKDESYSYPDYAVAFKDWDSFINCSIELKTEIHNWLKRYGADDINFYHTV